MAVEADAWHHQSDAITSAAAFVGISIAILGGPGWEQADDWAALVAAGVIGTNGVVMLRASLRDLMDRAPSSELLHQISEAALHTEGVLAIEKLKVRRSGMGLYVDLHVQANPTLSLHDAHILSGMVKSAIRRDVPSAIGVLIPHGAIRGARASMKDMKDHFIRGLQLLPVDGTRKFRLVIRPRN